jgi:hypothetical protein
MPPRHCGPSACRRPRSRAAPAVRGQTSGVANGSEGTTSQPLEAIDLTSELGESQGRTRPTRRCPAAGWVALVVVVVGVAAAWGAVVVGSRGSRAHARRRPIETLPIPARISVPGLIPIELPALREIPHARPLFTRRIPWGTGPGSVGFSPIRRSGPVGPAAFSADHNGNVVVFDAVHQRLIELLDGRAVAVPVPGSSELGTGPVVMDAQLRLIASDGGGGFFVSGSNGARLIHYPPRDFPAIAGVNAQQLAIDGPDVFVVADNARFLVLHDNGLGYRPMPTARWEQNPIQIKIRYTGDISVGRATQHGVSFALHAPWSVSEFVASRLRSDGTIITAATVDAPSSSPPNRAMLRAYILVAIDRHGHAKAEQFPATNFLTDSRGMFDLHDTYFGVMSDTPRAGVTIAGYAYPGTSAK